MGVARAQRQNVTHKPARDRFSDTAFAAYLPRNANIRHNCFPAAGGRREQKLRRFIARKGHRLARAHCILAYARVRANAARHIDGNHILARRIDLFGNLSVAPCQLAVETEPVKRIHNHVAFRQTRRKRLHIADYLYAETGH